MLPKRITTNMVFSENNRVSEGQIESFILNELMNNIKFKVSIDYYDSNTYTDVEVVGEVYVQSKNEYDALSRYIEELEEQLLYYKLLEENEYVGNYS